MTEANIPHEYEADISVVLHGREYRFTVGFDLKARGASTVFTTTDDMWDDAEIIYLPRVDIRGLYDLTDATETNIYLRLDIESRGKVREALDNWMYQNLDHDDRVYFTLFDAQTGRELT